MADESDVEECSDAEMLGSVEAHRVDMVAHATILDDSDESSTVSFPARPRRRLSLVWRDVQEGRQSSRRCGPQIGEQDRFCPRGSRCSWPSPPSEVAASGRPIDVGSCGTGGQFSRVGLAGRSVG